MCLNDYQEPNEFKRSKWTFALVVRFPAWCVVNKFRHADIQDEMNWSVHLFQSWHVHANKSVLSGWSVFFLSRCNSSSALFWWPFWEWLRNKIHIFGVSFFFTKCLILSLITCVTGKLLSNHWTNSDACSYWWCLWPLRGESLNRQSLGCTFFSFISITGSVIVKDGPNFIENDF